MTAVGVWGRAKRTLSALWVVAVVVAFAVLISRDLAGVAAALRTAGVWSIMLSGTLILGAKLLFAETFGSIAREAGVLMPWRKRQRIYHRAQVAKYLPGFVWQFASKGVLLIDAGASALQAVRIIATEQAWIIGGAVLTGAFLAVPAAAAGASLAIGPWTGQLLLHTIGLALVAIVAFLVLRRFRTGWLPRAPRSADIGRLLVAWSALATAFALLGATQVRDSIGPEGWMVLLAAFPVAYVAGYVTPFAPGGLGVREAVLVLLVTPAVGIEAATTAALLARAVYLAVEGVLAVLIDRVPLPRTLQGR